MDEYNPEYDARTSVISEAVNCPQCGLPAQLDNYYVVEEERVICDWCGYTLTKSYNETKASKGYGSIHCIKNETKVSEEVIRLKLPLSLEERQRIITEMEATKTESSFFVWSDVTKQLDCLIGTMPETLNERYEKESLQYRMQALMDNDTVFLKDFVSHEEDY